MLTTPVVTRWDETERPDPPERHSGLVNDWDLGAEIAALPGSLNLWHAGPEALPMVLAHLAMRRIEQLAREGRHPALIAPNHLRVDSRSEAQFLHAAATVVLWSSHHLRPSSSLVPPPPSVRAGRKSRKAKRRIARPVSLGDLQAAYELARDWQYLETVQIGLATGDMLVTGVRGRNVWVENRRRADVESLDIQLEQVTVLDPIDDPDDDADASLIRRWFEANRGRSYMLHVIPESVRTAAWRQARRLLVAQGTTIPDTSDLGGLTLAQARDCYAFLLAYTYLNELCTVFLETPETLLWGIKPVALRHFLARHVEQGVADSFIAMCRFDPTRSPASAPLIPHGELLLIPSALVSAVGFERCLLRAASADPSGAGELGRVLGNRAKRWVERLGQIEGVRVADRVKVKDASGKLLGDLDVVAWDSSTNLAVVFEVKWPIDALTLTESYKVDAHFSSGREQIRRLSAVIASGLANVAWPSGWAVNEETEFRWWVASAQQLDSSPEVGAQRIGSTSLRLVEQLLPQPSLQAFVSALDGFPMPREGIEYDLVPIAVAAGDVTIRGDALAIRDMPSAPADRRTSSGWT